MEGSSYDTVLHVRADECEGAEVACNDDAVGFQSRLTLDARGGQRYVVFVDGYGASRAGDYVLRVRPGYCEGDEPPPVVNEENAAAIYGFGALEGSTDGASADHDANCGSFWAGAGPEVVYAFHAEATGAACVSLAGSTYDTVLHVRTADGETQLACNDDAVGLQSRLTLDMVSGQTYLLFVDGYGHASGDFQLSVSPGPCR